MEEQQQTRSATPRASPAPELRAAQLGAEAAALREELLASEEVAAWSRKHAVQLEAELEQCRRELAECKEQQALEASRRTRPGQSSSKSRQAAWQAAPALSEELEAMASGDAAAGPKVPSAQPKMVDRKARLQAQLSRSPGKTERHAEPRPAGSPSSGSQGSSSCARSAMPGDMASLGRLLSGGGFLGHLSRGVPGWPGLPLSKCQQSWGS
ncbi:unnamed protein product [Effrenium voratum]|nr:unnamed protein product [Effrenium voratum]